MNSKRYLILFVLFIGSVLLPSCSSDSRLKLDYSFEVAKDVTYGIEDFQKIEFEATNNLDLGFYKGQVWIKLQTKNGSHPASYIVTCNDLINRNYRFYKLNKSTGKLDHQKNVDFSKDDARSYNFSKPNFQINLNSDEQSTYFITTYSDGRILQATPSLLRVNDFQLLKQKALIFDLIFYGAMFVLLLINIFYFKMIERKTYIFYVSYIISGCFMYLFVEGRLYGLGLSNNMIDHLMFITIRAWILFGVLFAMHFLDTKTTNPKYFKFIFILLTITLGGSTIYQLTFPIDTISTLHMTENIIGFIWIILSLTTVGIAFKRRKLESTYYLISYTVFLIFVTLGLIDSHTTMLIGDPFSYFKIGTFFELMGFSYFISILLKNKLLQAEKLKEEIRLTRLALNEKEQLLASSSENLKEKDLKPIFNVIENSLSDEGDWSDFEEKFALLNPNFLEALVSRHPELTKSDLRLLMLTKMGYSQKEIASTLDIAPGSVKKARSRVRKKLQLDVSIKLNEYLQHI